MATFVDMAKAWMQLFIKILQKFGFIGNLLNLLQNYLENSKQKTLADGITSQSRNISCGISQGSTVGPPLFILCINDISSIPNHCKYQLYADASDCFIYLVMLLMLTITQVLIYPT